MSRSKLFISGSISGRPYKEAAIHFNSAATLAYQIGFDPVNPIQLCRPYWAWWRAWRFAYGICYGATLSFSYEDGI